MGRSSIRREECVAIRKATTQPYLCIMRKIYTHLDWVLKRFISGKGRERERERETPEGKKEPGGLHEQWKVA